MSDSEPLLDFTLNFNANRPTQLVLSWLAGARDRDTADALLEPYRISGFLACSDASGLTRRTERTGVVATQAVIARANGIIHGVGKSLGGRPVGTWFADNTCMFYPGPCSGDLVAVLAGTHRLIRDEVSLQVGFSLHYGTFYEIAGALYGNDASTAETLAEEHAGAGETLVTGPALAAFSSPPQVALRRRPELDPVVPSGVFRVHRGMTTTVATRDRNYPHPFSEPFLRDLLALPPDCEREQCAGIESRYSRMAAIAFVVLDRHREDSGTVAALDEIAADFILEAAMNAVDPSGRSVIQIHLGEALLALPSADIALLFARRARAMLADTGLSAGIGIDLGRVIFFGRDGSSAGIVGGPVNTASKLAFDYGEMGTIQMTERAVAALDSHPGGSTRQIRVGGRPLGVLRL